MPYERHLITCRRLHVEASIAAVVIAAAIHSHSPAFGCHA
jgi:hypothetical protein